VVAEDTTLTDTHQEGAWGNSVVPMKVDNLLKVMIMTHFQQANIKHLDLEEEEMIEVVVELISNPILEEEDIIGVEMVETIKEETTKEETIIEEIIMTTTTTLITSSRDMVEEMIDIRINTETETIIPLIIKTPNIIIRVHNHQ
jgi:hypothetical protein